MRWATYRRLATLGARPQIQGTSAIHVEIHSLLRDIAEAQRSIGRKAYASDEGIDATLALMHKLLEELHGASSLPAKLDRFTGHISDS